MKVRELLAQILKADPDADVKVAMYYGPGAPRAVLYDPVVANRSDSEERTFWITADEMRLPRPERE